MARELVITIKANGSQAKSELAGVEKSIDGVTTAAGSTEKAVASMGVNVGKVFAGVAAGLAAAGIGDAARKAVESASRLQDAAQRIGISAEAIQKLGFAAKQGGSSIDAVATAIGRMSDMLGSKNADKILAQIGLSFDDIKGKSPDQTFIAIADAAAKIEDPLKRADFFTNAFGHGALELMPAAVAGFKAVGDQAPIMSNALVTAGDNVGDAWDKMQARIGNLQAQALIPFLDFFQTHVPQSLQVAAAGILSFLPSMDTLALALTGIIAAGKGGAVLTFFTTTLPGAIVAFISGAGAAMLTFFTTTLPAAFVAVITFLGPQGLIAVGLIALGLVWYKWGDQISAVVQKVYTAIKTWLVDKFTAVVDSVKAKVAAISGFFADMYDKVVGHSFVPDMISRIGEEFGKLNALMVDPTRRATDGVMDLFDGLLTRLSSKITSVLPSIFGGSDGGGGFFGQIMRGGLSALLGPAGPISGLISKGIEALGALALKGLSSMWHGIQGLFGTDEEARLVNPARDQFLSQFGGGGTGAGSGFMNLAAQLTQITGEEGGGALFRALTAADTMPEFNAAIAAINQALTGTARTSERGIGGVTRAADGLNVALTGSDEAIKQLGVTQDRVVEAMLAGFDRLIGKLDEFLGRLGGAGDAVAAVIDRTNTSPIVRGTEPTSGLFSDPTGRSEVVSYANEGRVTRPTLAMIGDASEPEYVLHESTVKGLASRGKGGVTVTGGINISISGAGKNADALARELAPKILEQIGRFNVNGSRRSFKVIAGTA